MTKARTLADFISDGSPLADGTISVSEVSGAAPLASPTFTGTVTVPNITTTGDISFGANDKAIFNNILEVYHSGSHSYISENSTGDLYIQGTNIGLRKGDGTQTYLYANAGGSVDIKYNNATKLQTTASGAAITGKTTTDELDLNAIAATIADTAVDIFVYDTRKDSDGGAWRKRTQGTSWYNETLNTATRGSRKDFPTVAVIVGTSTKLTIYDGDDPDLPMWMVFDANVSANDLMRNSGIECIAAKNGSLIIGLGNGFGLIEANMVADYGYHWTSTANAGYFNSHIDDRNQAKSFTRNVLTPIVDNYTNDVAMTVLPNAPIDAATGLPVPTIAVATNGGVSVIKDDGTVVDITAGSYSVSALIAFTKEQNLLYGFDFSADKSRYIHIQNIPTADTNIGTYGYERGSDDLEFYTSRPESNPDLFVAKYLASSEQFSFAGDYVGGNVYGLAKLDRNQSNPDKGMVAFIDAEHNTGYQVGDIKLATLSDTDATNVTGTQMLSNNTFDTDTTGWTPITANLSVSSGIIHVEQTSGSTGMAYQAVSTVVGKTYTIEGSFQTRTGSIYGGGFYVGTSAGAQDNVSLRTKISQGSFSPVSATFTATGSTTYISLISWGGTGDWIEFDYVNLRLAEEDRSVNGNGLQVFGTVTKSAVATGADLVAYSGFSDTNYLEQPYNSDLDFGTGDFCFTWWANVTSVPSYQAHFCRETPTFSGSSIEIFTESSSGYLRTYITDDGYTTFDVWNSNGIAYGRGWQHFASVRRGNVVSTYINGILDNNNTLVQAVGSLNNTSAKLFIGCQGNQSSPMNSGSIALFRASATAPSPEAIKRIYEDEKVLFQENAKAVLYGTSDAVTALAFDDTTNLLHVGTSAGRSVFQGLRRVDNTTTGVTTAISASNGLVVDQ